MIYSTPTALFVVVHVAPRAFRFLGPEHIRSVKPARGEGIRHPLERVFVEAASDNQSAVTCTVKYAVDFTPVRTLFNRGFVGRCPDADQLDLRIAKSSVEKVRSRMRVHRWRRDVPYIEGKSARNENLVVPRVPRRQLDVAVAGRAEAVPQLLSTLSFINELGKE